MSWSQCFYLISSHTFVKNSTIQYPNSFHTNYKLLAINSINYRFFSSPKPFIPNWQFLIKSLHLYFVYIQCLMRTIVAKFEHCSLGSFPYYCFKKLNRIILSFSNVWKNITPLQKKNWVAYSIARSGRTLHTGYHVIIHAATCFRVLCPLLENVDWCEAAQGISILYWLCSYCL